MTNARRRHRMMFGMALTPLLASCGWWSDQEEILSLYGEIEVQEIRVSAKIAGRLTELDVNPGDQVSQGASLFRIESPELNARLAQAEAARDAAQAVAQRTESGSRDEELDMARLDWQRAQTQVDVLSSTLQRTRNLHQEGLISRQQFEEAEAAWRAAEDQAMAAHARYQMAVNGAHRDDRLASNAQWRQAQAVVQEVEALLADAQQKAPVDAVVESVLVQPGELVPTGSPVLTLVNPADQRLVLMVREDRLQNFTIGQGLTGWVPALGRHLDFSVQRLQVLPDFATWRQGGDVQMHLRTFQVEAKPTEVDMALRPGMTVMLEVPK